MHASQSQSQPLRAILASSVPSKPPRRSSCMLGLSKNMQDDTQPRSAGSPRTYASSYREPYPWLHSANPTSRKREGCDLFNIGVGIREWRRGLGRQRGLCCGSKAAFAVQLRPSAANQFVCERMVTGPRPVFKMLGTFPGSGIAHMHLWFSKHPHSHARLLPEPVCCS
ncbi:hypothetical protein LZ31DRAFT_65188 [Colletotrichum somersetense]|nr:hypothetical protein LZ31DRAFT_65188 [Colletotrichum somersetense]